MAWLKSLRQYTKAYQWDLKELYSGLAFWKPTSRQSPLDTSLVLISSLTKTHPRSAEFSTIGSEQKGQVWYCGVVYPIQHTLVVGVVKVTAFQKWQSLLYRVGMYKIPIFWGRYIFAFCYRNLAGKPRKERWSYYLNERLSTKSEKGRLSIGIWR